MNNANVLDISSYHGFMFSQTDGHRKTGSNAMLLQVFYSQTL